MGESVGVETVAEAYLTLLKARGIDWLFANAGTDFAPIIEALSRGAGAGLAMPEALAAPHETVAVGMAHGYYLATGRPQAVIPGAQWFVAYDPLSGDELWRVDHGRGFSNIARPLV